MNRREVLKNLVFAGLVGLVGCERKRFECKVEDEFIMFHKSFGNTETLEVIKPNGVKVIYRYNYSEGKPYQPNIWTMDEIKIIGPDGSISTFRYNDQYSTKIFNEAKKRYKDYVQRLYEELSKPLRE